MVRSAISERRCSLQLDRKPRGEASGSRAHRLNLVANELLDAHFSALSTANVVTPEILQATTIGLSDTEWELVGLDQSLVVIVKKRNHGPAPTGIDDGLASIRSKAVASPTN